MLAGDLVVQSGWRGLRSTEPKVIELSGLLKAALIHPVDERPDNFSSTGSVQRKTFDIATQHPGYTGKPTRGGPHDIDVLREFMANPERMGALARKIRSGITAALAPEPLVDPELDTLSASEGNVLAVLHLRRERDAKLRRSKLAYVKARGGRFACEVCGFDFAVIHGYLGEG